MDSGALTPSNDPMSDMDLSEIVEQEAISEAEVEDKELASLKASRAWQRIAKDMQDDIDGFRTGKDLAIDPKDALADIGQRFVIASTLADKLQAYLDRVNGAAERVAESERKAAEQRAKADKPA